MSHKFGIDVNVNEDLAQLNSSDESLSTRVDKLINLVEEMHIVSRDNSAIFMELLFGAEKKLNKRIDDLREEMITLINARTGDSFTSTSVADKINKYKVEESSTLKPIKESADNKGSAPAKRTSIVLPNTRVSFTNGSAPKSNTPPSPLLAYETITVTPLPGFVIKTKRLLGNKEKAFINVFHHPQIELEPVGLPKGHVDDKPYIVIDELATTMDKEGASCLMFNIAVSSEFFRQPNHGNPIIADLTITSPYCVQKIIHKINMNFSEYLDEGNYVLPRLTLGYKGDAIPLFTIPVDVKKPPLSPATIAAGGGRSSFTGSMVGEERQSVTPTFGIAATDRTTPPSENSYNNSSSNNNSSTYSLSNLPMVVEEGSSAGNSNNNSTANMTSGVMPRRTSEISVNDNDSVVSDITHDTMDGSTQRRPSQNNMSRRNGSMTAGVQHSKPKRKSIFDTSQMAMHGGAITGRNMLSGTMLDYIREECVDTKTASSIKEESVSNPGVLLGWQINIEPSEKHDEKASGLYVVTDMRKNLMSKTEFKVSRFHQDDMWLKLKRLEGKSGYEFRPMRKVLFGLADDEDSSMA